MFFLRTATPYLVAIFAVSILSVSVLGSTKLERSIWDEIAGFRSGLISFERRTKDFVGDPFVHGFAAKYEIVPTPVDGGIKENVPVKFRDRYIRWKAELLSTAFGREQWLRYANRKDFVLTITVSGDRKKGAGTDKFLWNEEGRFVGATITLGAKIDQGFPNPIYYPVLNSLSQDSTTFSISGRLLAATKMSHEFGHVNQAATANVAFLQLQNRLMPEYISIFLRNGLNTKDKKLVELAREMGGTPVQIWESREYWSEVNAMLFLNDRIGSEIYYCHVFNKIRRNLETYAPEYMARFGQQPEFAGSPCWN